MRHQYLCIAVIVSSALLADARLHFTEAASSRLDHRRTSPVLVLNMRSYRWKVPEFRMAGTKAYAVVEVENPHDFSLEMFVGCRTRDGRIPEMSGYYTIPPDEFLRLDTRRGRDPLQNGEGVRVKCHFRADGSARVKAWIYDERQERGSRDRGNTSLFNG